MGDDIAERLVDFAVRVIRLVEALPETRTGNHIGGQLLRAGTSAGANYEEARGAESGEDFAHKVGVAGKETRESMFWLKVIERAELVRPGLLTDIVQESRELTAILTSSRATAKRNLKEKRRRT